MPFPMTTRHSRPDSQAQAGVHPAPYLTPCPTPGAAGAVLP